MELWMSFSLIGIFFLGLVVGIVIGTWAGFSNRS
jgi:hypothetical protein